MSSETAWSGPPPPPLLTCKLLQGRDACCYPKGHEARCPPGAQETKIRRRAVSPLTKGSQGPGEGGGSGREPGGRARGPGKDGGLEAWMDGQREGGWIDGWTDELTRRGRGSCSTAAGRQKPKKSRRCGAEGEGTRGAGRGAQKWGAWETRGEDYCGWGKPEAGAEGAEAGGQQATRKIKANRCGGRYWAPAESEVGRVGCGAVSRR